LQAKLFAQTPHRLAAGKDQALNWNVADKRPRKIMTIRNKHIYSDNFLSVENLDFFKHL
jgi:hypothetical protein